MKNYFKTKIKYLPTLACLTVEMGVSGYFTPIDGFWLFTRVGLMFIFISLVIAEQIKTINWLPLALVALSLMSIRAEWQLIEETKKSKKENISHTKIKEPKEPALADCKGLVKRRKDDCDANNKEMQLTYSTDLREYNKEIRQSEKNIQSIEITLDWYDQQPVWIYVFLSCVMSFLTFVSTPDEQKKEPVKNALDEKDLRARVIARIEGGMSNLQISTELGVDRRKVAKIKNSLAQYRSVPAQKMSNVVNINEVKRA